ncbi:TPA: hypothetical protein ACP32N_005009 [Pseudomonas aeruginosa]
MSEAFKFKRDIKNLIEKYTDSVGVDVISRELCALQHSLEAKPTPPFIIVNPYNDKQKLKIPFVDSSFLIVKRKSNDQRFWVFRAKIRAKSQHSNDRYTTLSLRLVDNAGKERHVRFRFCGEGRFEFRSNDIVDFLFVEAGIYGFGLSSFYIMNETIGSFYHFNYVDENSFDEQVPLKSWSNSAEVFGNLHRE